MLLISKRTPLLVLLSISQQADIFFRSFDAVFIIKSSQILSNGVDVEARWGKYTIAPFTRSYRYLLNERSFHEPSECLIYALRLYIRDFSKHLPTDILCDDSNS